MLEKKPQWKKLDTMDFALSNCPLCKISDAKLKFQKKIRNYLMQYYICNSCNVLFANPRATPQSLKNLYASADFFAGGEPGSDHLNYHTFVGGEKYLRMTARQRINRIKKFIPTGKMLEIASAAGFFLIEAKNAGYDISGIEFSKPLAEWAAEKWKVDVIPESIESLALTENYYDVIASWGVMTIIQDPKALMSKIHSALKPGGYWAFNTYYYEGLWPRIVKNKWDILVVNFSQIYTKKLLIDTLEKHGFKLVSVRRDVPYTDLEKISDKLAQTLKMSWLPKFITRMRLNKIIIKLPLPDVMEYIFQKN